jgi:hypothetical protein
MQRIVYRQITWVRSAYDTNNRCTVLPHSEQIDKACAEFEQWANTNGYRVTSVTTTSGALVMGKVEQAVGTFTAGLIFVCEELGAAAR